MANPKRGTQIRLERETAHTLRRLAAELGYRQTRGIMAGELGSIAQMLEAVARGDLEIAVRSAVRPQSDERTDDRREPPPIDGI